MIKILELYDSIELYNNNIKTYEDFCEKNKLNDYLCFILNKFSINKNLKYKIIQQTLFYDKGFKFNKLIEICSLFSSNNIKYCIVKGPIISKYIYDSFYIRDYDDFDIIIHESNYVDAIKLLLKNGFTHLFLKSVAKFNLKKEEDQNIIIKNIDGDDVSLYNDNINLSLELKTSFRFCCKKITEYLFSEIVKIQIEDKFVYSLSEDGTFLLSIINLYYSFYTHYGIEHKFKFKSIIEIIIFIRNNYKKLNILKINNFIIKNKLFDIFGSVCWIINKYNIFEEVEIFVNSINCDKEISIFRNSNFDILFFDVNARKNFFNKCYISAINYSYPIYVDIDEYPEHPILNYKKEIKRTFSEISIHKYLYYSFYESEHALHIFYKIDKKMDEYSLIIKISNNIFEYNLSYFTKYSDNVYEVKSDLPIYRFMTNINKNGFINGYISISKSEIYRYLDSDEFLVDISIFKIMIDYDKNVLLTDDFESPWHKIKFNHSKIKT